MGENLEKSEADVLKNDERKVSKSISCTQCASDDFYTNMLLSLENAVVRIINASFP